MSRPSPQNYYIVNRVLDPNGKKLAITFNGSGQPATVTPLNNSSNQQVSPNRRTFSLPLCRQGSLTALLTRLHSGTCPTTARQLCLSCLSTAKTFRPPGEVVMLLCSQGATMSGLCKTTRTVPCQFSSAAGWFKYISDLIFFILVSFAHFSIQDGGKTAYWQVTTSAAGEKVSTTEQFNPLCQPDMQFSY
jgi:hypothetical protein